MFNRVFDNEDIAEADDFTPEVLVDTYVNMKLALTQDSEGIPYVKVTKALGMQTVCRLEHRMIIQTKTPVFMRWNISMDTRL